MLYKNPLGMTDAEVDALKGKQVVLIFRKPDDAFGRVTEVQESFKDGRRCIITLDNGIGAALGHLESIEIFDEK